METIPTVTAGEVQCRGCRRGDVHHCSSDTLANKDTETGNDNYVAAAVVIVVAAVGESTGGHRRRHSCCVSVDGLPGERRANDLGPTT